MKLKVESNASKNMYECERNKAAVQVNKQDVGVAILIPST